MENIREPLQQLTEIRDMMERSSRFISLSGLSGIAAGVIAMAGSAIAYFNLDFDHRYFYIKRYSAGITGLESCHSWLFITMDALIMLVLTLSLGIFFTTRKARRKGLKVWDNTARRLVINLLIPLATGGIFCLILFYHQQYLMMAPATLLFYGLALINASKYTFHEIRILGISQIVLGLLASWLPGYGLLFWAAGFGVLHIIYGSMMYFKYEVTSNE